MVAIEMPIVHIVAVTATVGRQKFSLGAVGICHLSENPGEKGSAVNMLSIPAEVKFYMLQEKIKIRGDIKIDILQKPEHAELIDWFGWRCL